MSPASDLEDRQQQEHVDRDEDRVEAVPVDVDEDVLQRQHDEERRGEREVVAAARVRERHEFAQRDERDEREQQDHAGLAEQEREADHQHHHPPRLDARVEVVDRRCGWPLATDGLSAKPTSDATTARRRCRRRAIRSAVAAVIASGGSSASSASRVRATNASLLLAGAELSGAPTVSVHSSGTGSSLPLGITRREFSIHTGTNSTSGTRARRGDRCRS